MTNLTANQAHAMQSLTSYVGRTVQVGTSHFDANVAPTFNPVCIANSAALRGLERKGFIKIERAYWKGADVTVLRGIQ
jgi:hypothetical protein